MKAWLRRLIRREDPSGWPADVLAARPVLVCPECYGAGFFDSGFGHDDDCSGPTCPGCGTDALGDKELGTGYHVPGCPVVVAEARGLRP